MLKKVLTKKEQARKIELEKLVKESGVEKELENVDWDKFDPLFEGKEGEPMPERFWNYFLLKMEWFDEDEYSKDNIKKLEKLEEGAKKIRKKITDRDSIIRLLKGSNLIGE